MLMQAFLDPLHQNKKKKEQRREEKKNSKRAKFVDCLDVPLCFFGFITLSFFYGCLLGNSYISLGRVFVPRLRSLATL
jgi:hypothetical protein